MKKGKVKRLPKKVNKVGVRYIKLKPLEYR